MAPRLVGGKTGFSCLPISNIIAALGFDVVFISFSNKFEFPALQIHRFLKPAVISAEILNSMEKQVSCIPQFLQHISINTSTDKISDTVIHKIYVQMFTVIYGSRQPQNLSFVTFLTVFISYPLHSHTKIGIQISMTKFQPLRQFPS